MATKIWYRKVGRGSFRFNNRIIKPNEKFLADPDEIPAAFKDLIKPLQDVPVAPAVKSVSKGVIPEYVKEKSGRKGYFNVIQTSTNKKINEKVLTEEVADQLILDMQK